VLDWKGKARVETGSIDVACEFDPASLLREVVATGGLKDSSIKNLPGPSFQFHAMQDAFGRDGRRFGDSSLNTVRAAASDFFPLGFQFLAYRRHGRCALGWKRVGGDLLKDGRAK
jgi:hypothetical protein